MEEVMAAAGAARRHATVRNQTKETAEVRSIHAPSAKHEKVEFVNGSGICGGAQMLVSGLASRTAADQFAQYGSDGQSAHLPSHGMPLVEPVPAFSRAMSALVTKHSTAHTKENTTTIAAIDA